MKCNLDCTYCPTGTYGGHDNSTRHPPLDQCLKSIDFMFAYVDLYLANRINSLRSVILNVYGGEAMHHPDIESILTAVRERHVQYQSKWNLTVTVTTNAVVSAHRLASIIPLVDEFTVSYHAGATSRQKNQVRSNLLSIAKTGIRCKVVVLMDPATFQDSLDQIEWCKKHNVRYLARQLDHPPEQTQFNHSEHQVTWFQKEYQARSNDQIDFEAMLKRDAHNNIDMAKTGRACCGGRSFSADKNYRSRVAFVDNKFPDWYCSVNHFFLYVKQVNGEIYTNKDCKMNFDKQVGPIGNLNDCKSLLDQTQKWIQTKTMPVIQCKKFRCLCGLCAPKARDLDAYKQIFKKYEIPDINLLPQA